MKLLSVLLILIAVIACLPDPNSIAVKEGKALFNKKHLGKNKVIGCVSCHSIKPDQVIVGPSLSGLSTRAKYMVEGQTAKEYIRNSITNPDAFIVGGFLPATMYPHYKQELSAKEIETLVAYLSKL